jgi:hypothetical protein
MALLCFSDHATPTDELIKCSGRLKLGSSTHVHKSGTVISALTCRMCVEEKMGRRVDDVDTM